MLPEKLLKVSFNPVKFGALKKEVLQPGSRGATDQFVSLIQGQILHMYGKENTKEMYSGGTIYFDEVSGLIFNCNQVLLEASENIREKHMFEQLSHTCGVTITLYHSDN